MSRDERRRELPVPPKDAEVKQTVCQFCTVGCGYTVYRWPVGRRGGLAPHQNAFGVDLRRPQPALSGLSYTESMHSVVRLRGGQRVNVAIVPARNSPINLRGDYSSRGGASALTTYSAERATRARLTTPLLRVGGDLQPVPWDEALDVLTGVLGGLLDRHGPDALTAKAFDHGGGGGGFENNYAVGKLLFTGLGMTKVAIHNRPAYNSEVWGSRDRGVHELHYTAEDARVADTLVLWGANSYETASVFFTEHLLPNFQGGTAGEKAKVFATGEPAGPARAIIVDPRRTSTWAVLDSVDSARVLHLRPNLGTDVVLANTIARLVYERGLHDAVMLAERTDAATFAEYRARSLELGRSLEQVLSDAERITGVARADMETAARWMAEPKGAHRRRTLTLYEKGMIWNQRNYDTIAALVQLSVLAGNIGRPGAGCGRQGGHQEGYVRPPYPGPRPPLNVDQHLIDGGGRLYWVIGTNPYSSTPRAQQFRGRIQERTQALTRALRGAPGGEPGTREGRVQATLRALAEGDGLFMVVSELYLTDTARDAHLVLPAAGWGEMDLTSINCNSRLLRLYERFMDPPGDAKPDWEIMALVAQRLRARYAAAGAPDRARAFEGFGWRSDEDVFLAGAAEFPDNTVDESGAESLPAECYKGVTYALLRQLGQAGIQTPVRRDPQTKALVGTPRRYTRRFATPDGRFRWYGTDPWTGFPPQVQKYLEGDRAARYPFWLTTGRNQLIWQTGYHDQHLPQKMEAVPLPYVELHPDDATRLGVQAHSLVELYNEEGNGVFQVRVLDSTKPGVVFALQYHPRGSANELTSAYTDPKTTIPWYKGTRVAIRPLQGGVVALSSASGLAGNDVR